MSKKQQDLYFGLSKETELLETIRGLPFCEEVVKTISMYDFIDFESENAFCEIKSRRINHNQYPTALIGCNKINKMKRNGKQYNYLVWNYLDGTYYMKYDPNNFNFTAEEQKVCRDGKCEISQVYKIPYQILTKVQ
jgi:hypothetical protein